MRRFKVVTWLPLLVAVLGLTHGVAEAQFQRKVYSVKFLCGEKYPNAAGTVAEGPVKPGNYETAINVHNPTLGGTFFLKRAVLLYDDANPPTGFEIPVPPDPINFAFLNPRWGMEIDCPDIRQVLLSMPATPHTFIKGYVIIETFLAQNKLDVVAAYTSHGLEQIPGGGTCSISTSIACFADADCPPGETCVFRYQPFGFSEDIERFEPTLIP